MKKFIKDILEFLPGYIISIILLLIIVDVNNSSDAVLRILVGAFFITLALFGAYELGRRKVEKITK